MHKVLGAVLLAFIFSSCVPTLLSSKNWVRIAFAPDASERNAACNRALSNAANNNLSNLVSGVANLNVPNAKMSFYSSLGGTYTLCSIFGLGGGLPPGLGVPEVYSFIVFEQDQIKSNQVKLRVDFLDDNKVVLGSVVANAPDAKTGESSFGFRDIKGSDLDVMNRSAGFNVVLNRGQGDETYPVTRESLGTALLQLGSPRVQ
jgi:hypothetical protein